MQAIVCRNIVLSLEEIMNKKRVFAAKLSRILNVWAASVFSHLQRLVVVDEIPDNMGYY